MPIYGDEKWRQMARAILPSTYRKGAREDLAKIKRAARSNIRQELRNLRNIPVDEIDDVCECDLNYYPYEKISMAVQDRRNGDKLGPIQRWAEAKVAHLPKDRGRLLYLDARMPNNIIGQHAVWGHLQNEPAFEYPKDHNSRYGGSWHKEYAEYNTWNEYFQNRAARQKAKDTERRERQRVKLTEIIHEGNSGKLNDFIKVRHRTVHAIEHVRSWGSKENNYQREVDIEFVHCDNCAKPRCLLGVHDIDDFLDFCFSAGSWRGGQKNHPEYHDALKEFGVIEH